MPDRDGSSTTTTANVNILRRRRFCCCNLAPLIPILLETTRIIFIENPKLFFTIYALTTLPLSLLLVSLSLSSRALKSRIAHLEWLANVVPTWVEADNVRAEARADLAKLFRNKALYGGPIVVLSVVAIVAAVSSSVIACRKKKRPTIRNVVKAVRVTWVRPLLTCVVSCAVLVTWGLVMHVLNASAGYPASVAVTVVGVVVEVYVMAVISLAMVVSVAEERVGVDAVRVGLGLMKGRWICGWVLSGLVLVSSGCVGWEIEGLLIEGRNLGRVMRAGLVGGLVGLLGWVVLWSYVVVTVFYYECRKRHVISRDEDQLINDYDYDDDDNEI